MEKLSGVKGRLLTLPASITLGLSVANTLAYLYALSSAKKMSFLKFFKVAKKSFFVVA